MVEEIDFEIEKKNMETCREFFEGRDDIYVPKVYPDLCSHRICMMEFIHGIKVSNVKKLRENSISTRRVAQLCVQAFSDMMFQTNFLHVDPHAGNLLVRTVTIRVNNAGGLTTAQAATASVNGVSSIASATFAYQAERTLTAQASGTVSAINVQEGGAVSKGDIIIELTGDELTESIQSASESLRSAEISMQNQQDNMSNYTITSPISGTIIEKDAKQGDALTSGSTLCVIYDLSYLEMVINVDELQIGALSVGQKVQLTADAVTDKTYVGTVTRVSMKGSSSGGTTTYPITIRIDNTDGLRPGMNANAEIVVAEANNALVVPNAAVIRGGYVLVSKKSPSAANAVEDMDAPDGYVYVKVETGVSDDSYTEIKSGLQEDDTVAYDTSSVMDDYYSDSSYSDSIW